MFALEKGEENKCGSERTAPVGDHFAAADRCSSSLPYRLLTLTSTHSCSVTPCLESQWPD